MSAAQVNLFRFKAAVPVAPSVTNARGASRCPTAIAKTAGAEAGAALNLEPPG
jgi:hypothetical protein